MQEQPFCPDGKLVLDEYLRRVSSVTIEDVERVANAYLDPDAATLVLLRPG